MKRLIALAAALAIFAGILGACTPREEDEPHMELKTPAAMASFGAKTATGDLLPEPEDLTFSGKCESAEVSVLVGDNDGSYAVRVLSGYGSEMCFTLTNVTPDVTTMLDIEEIHLRSDDAIAYSIYVNGKEVFGRTYAPIADGPNHAYFDIPAEVVGSTGTLQIRLVNRSEGSVRFHRVWAVSDPEGTARQQGLAKKMDMVLMLNEVPNNLNYSYLQELVNSYRCNDMYNVGLCWEINYLQWGKAKTEEYLNNVITASLMTGATLYLGINSWWAGTPSGMDGQGGYWQDVPYQQITWDPLDTDGRGHWQLTTPNEFSDTPWLSMNHDGYNAARVQRIRETVAYLQQRTAELALAGRQLPAIHLYTENEPYYWPINWSYYEYGSYPNGVGDFSPYVIADAAADGITLDPTDGLSEEEALWLYRNLHTYISEVGQAMADGLGYNYITIQDGTVTYPSEQIVSNSYSHTPIQAIYPNWDSNRRAWENHVLSSIGFGGEWSVYLNDDAVRSLDYLLSYGSFSNINAERAGFPGGFASTDFRVLSQCYAYGLEGVVIYNVLADSDQNNVLAASKAGNEPVSWRYYGDKPLFESDFSRKAAYSVGNTLVAINDLRLDGNAVCPTKESGTLIYRIRNAAQYGDGLRLFVEGSFTDGGKIELLVGGSRDDLRSVGIYEAGELNVKIDPALYDGAQDVYIAVRLRGDGMTSGQLAGLCISRVAIGRGGVTNGRTDGSVYTYDENRIRRQIIAARADVERLMEKYVQQAGGSLTTTMQMQLFWQGYELYAAGRYGDAFTAFSQVISQLLPATFVISGYGRLGQYPVSVAVEDSAKVTICLKEVSDDGIRFGLSASADTKVTVSFLTDSGKWSLRQEKNGDWSIVSGQTSPTDGSVSFPIEQAERISKEYPQSFEARMLYADTNSIVVASQDTRVTDYCHSATFAVSSTVEVLRGADGTSVESLTPCHISDLRAGDYVQVTRNENGLVSRVYAWYGQITGTVVSVEEMSLEGSMSNPFVTVRAADGTTIRLEIGYDCLLNFTGATGAMGKLALVERVGLEIGQQITVTYCPYTVNGRTRAMEIAD